MSVRLRHRDCKSIRYLNKVGESFFELAHITFKVIAMFIERSNEWGIPLEKIFG